MKGKRECEFLAAQSEAAPNLVKGEYRHDFGDTAGHTPLMKMYTLGHETSMTPIKSDGLRYHAAAPIISALRSKGYVKAVAYPSDEQLVFEAAKLFLETEGCLIAGESAHAVRAAIDAARDSEARGRRSASQSTSADTGSSNWMRIGASLTSSSEEEGEGPCVRRCEPTPVATYDQSASPPAE